MSQHKLLLFSNGSEITGGERPSTLAREAIGEFLGPRVRSVLFVPFAGVMRPHAQYAALVGERFAQLGYGLAALRAGDATAAEMVARAEALVVGGGNTFQLLRTLYELELIEPLRERVAAGVPYIGWSAGSNLACPTIRTTNDMPVVEPPSLRALGLVPFQINPHYTQAHPTGHHGETRDERLAEFIKLNPGVHVVGLREGSVLRLADGSLTLLGEHTARIFREGEAPREVGPADSLQFLLD